MFQNTDEAIVENGSSMRRRRGSCGSGDGEREFPLSPSLPLSLPPSLPLSSVDELAAFIRSFVRSFSASSQGERACQAREDERKEERGGGGGREGGRRAAAALGFVQRATRRTSDESASQKGLGEGISRGGSKL